MKQFNLKAFFITLLLFTSIITSMSVISFKSISAATTTSEILSATVEPKQIDSTQIHFYMAKEVEADQIINDKNFAPSMNKAELTDLLIYIDSLCNDYDIDYKYVKAIIANESRWKQNAVGSSLDYGLMQITPIASKAVGLNHGEQLFEPKYNVLSGIKLLARLHIRLDTIEEVLVAYNAGIGNVKKYGNNWVQKHKYLKGVNKWLKHYEQA